MNLYDKPIFLNAKKYIVVSLHECFGQSETLYNIHNLVILCLFPGLAMSF